MWLQQHPVQARAVLTECPSDAGSQSKNKSKESQCTFEERSDFTQGHRGSGSAGPRCRPPSKRRRRAREGGSRKAAQGGVPYLLPQQRSMPVLTSLLSTPATALSAIRVTPVAV